MASKSKSTRPTVSLKELNEMAGQYMFQKPVVDADGVMSTPRYSSGIAMFDKLLGGGLPIGKIISIGSEEGVGKTTQLLHISGNIVEQYNKRVVFIASEGGVTYDLVYSMGLAPYLFHPTDNPDGLLVLIEIKTVQKLEYFVKQYAALDDTALFVIDSTYSVVDEKSLDVNTIATESGAVGIRARMWSGVANILEAVIAQSNACMVLIHQARMNLSGFIPKMESSSNKALKFITSVEIWGKRKCWIGEGNITNKDGKDIRDEDAIGSIVIWTTKKNRLTKPYSAVEVPIIFGKGVSNQWAYRNWLEEHKYVNDKTGEVSEEPILFKKGGGYYKLTLPSGEYTGRGDSWAWEMMDTYWDEIVKYVESHGGFEARKATPEDQDTRIVD